MRQKMQSEGIVLAGYYTAAVSTTAREQIAPGVVPAEWWHAASDGRLQCDLCPRDCRLGEGQRGFCFVRERRGDHMVLTTYGRSTGFCVDPVEKKPLAHFLPGTGVLSFGTAGCNLGCRFCQNWDISKARDVERASSWATPSVIARAAREAGARAVAATYNDPVVFAEYAIDTFDACHDQGIGTIAVSAGYHSPAARTEFYRRVDAANIDLKAFTERFYRKLTFSHLAPVLDTLEWIRRETHVWLEVTTLLIPDENDGLEELDRLCAWVVEHLGPDTPLHFSGYHPDYRLERPATPPETLQRARACGLRHGLHHVYVGNADDPVGESTWCPGCRALLIGRRGYRITAWGLDAQGRCQRCTRPLAGRFEARPGAWGSRRLPVRLAP
jgi:pyruvate formate lyase activating enzyme